jgi:hypothetical protein
MKKFAFPKNNTEIAQLTILFRLVEIDLSNF